MKNLLLIVLLLIVLSSCTREYKETEIKTTEGVIMQVDSTKFSPAMVYVDESKNTVYIAQDKKINRMVLYDPFGVVIGTILFCLVIGLVVVVLGSIRD